MRVSQFTYNEGPVAAVHVVSWEFCKIYPFPSFSSPLLPSRQFSPLTFSIQKETACVRSRTFFHDNSGWRVTAVYLSSANNLECAGLLLTFDIPEGDQVSPFSSVIRLTWRRLLRWSTSALSCATVLYLDFVTCPRNCVMAAL